MPGITADSVLAVKALRRNGVRQRWTIGFRVLDGEQNRRVRRIRNLDVFTISPALDNEVTAAGPVPSRQPGIEVKVADARPYRPRVRGPHGGLGSHVATLVPCEVCGKAAGVASRSTVGRGLICDSCVDSVGHVLDYLDALDSTPQVIYEDALRDERVMHTDPHGEIWPGTRDRRWQP